MTEESPTPEPLSSDESPSARPGGFSSFWVELKRRKVVRVALTYLAVAWLLIEVTATVFPQLGMPEWAPTLVTLLFIVGFPITIILAWIFDVTPDGIKATQSLATASGSEKSLKKSSWGPLVFAAGLPTLIFGTLAVIFYLRSDPTSTLSSSKGSPPDSSPSPHQVEDLDKSIAVLPLVNMSPDPDNAFFAGGVQEEILTNLAKINDLLVIGRTSTLRYQGSTKSLNEIGSELGVNYLLEGSVQRAGDQVRVTVQLIESDTEAHLWAESYTRELDDFFSIISSISKEIAGQLQAVLTPVEISNIESPPTENLEAYNFYLRAQQSFGEERYRFLEKATELDPKFFNAWGLIAISKIISWRRDKNRNDPVMLEEALRAAEMAELWNPEEPRVHMMKATMTFNQTDDMEAVIQHTHKAIEKDPKIWTGIGWRYLQIGRVDEARLPMEAGVRENPFGTTYTTRMLNCYLQLGEWEEAARYIDSRRRLSGEDSFDSARWRWERARFEFLQTGDMAAYISARISVLRFLKSQRLDDQRMNGAIIDLGNQLIIRSFDDALDSISRFSGAGNFQFLSPSNRAPNSGSWNLHVEPIHLLAALIHFELENSTKSKEHAQSAMTFIQAIVDRDPIADPTVSSQLAICHALFSDEESVQFLIDEIRSKTAEPGRQYRFQARSEVHFAICYLILGDHERAIDLLENANKLHSPLFLNRELELWFVFDRLRGDPRFEALLK